MKGLVFIGALFLFGNIDFHNTLVTAEDTVPNDEDTVPNDDKKPVEMLPLSTMKPETIEKLQPTEQHNLVSEEEHDQPLKLVTDSDSNLSDKGDNITLVDEKMVCNTSYHQYDCCEAI